MASEASTPGGDVACSIVVPVCNKVDLTRQCLDALRRNTDDVLYEVVVVDNSSTDGTAELLAGLRPPFRSVCNEENIGFARACNQGAGAGSGEFVLFLNNDTLPLRGWLAALLECARQRPGAGIIGSKLIYPETDLIQHAGVGVSEAGSPYNMFRGLPADLPEANEEREYDAVTAACMLVRRSLFEKLGGFDESYVNGLEDVDFCFRARERGWKVLYCPASVVYHFEGMTPGRNEHNAENWALFRSRWGGKTSPTPPRVKRTLSRMGSPLLKFVETDGGFVMLADRKLYLCDRSPPRVRTYKGLARYVLAQLYFRLRYCHYLVRIRRLVRAARREGEGRAHPR